MEIIDWWKFFRILLIVITIIVLIVLGYAWIHYTKKRGRRLKRRLERLVQTLNDTHSIQPVEDWLRQIRDLIRHNRNYGITYYAAGYDDYPGLRAAACNRLKRKIAWLIDQLAREKKRLSPREYETREAYCKIQIEKLNEQIRNMPF